MSYLFRNARPVLSPSFDVPIGYAGRPPVGFSGASAGRSSYNVGDTVSVAISGANPGDLIGWRMRGPMTNENEYRFSKDYGPWADSAGRATVTWNTGYTSGLAPGRWSVDFAATTTAEANAAIGLDRPRMVELGTVTFDVVSDPAVPATLDYSGYYIRNLNYPNVREYQQIVGYNRGIPGDQWERIPVPAILAGIPAYDPMRNAQPREPQPTIDWPAVRAMICRRLTIGKDAEYIGCNVIMGQNAAPGSTPLNPLAPSDTGTRPQAAAPSSTTSTAASSNTATAPATPAAASSIQTAIANTYAQVQQATNSASASTGLPSWVFWGAGGLALLAIFRRHN